MTRLAALAAGLAMAAMAVAGQAGAATEAARPEAQDWHFEGLFGTYDRARLQRGYVVYRDVCAACHRLKYIQFRHLRDIGLSEAEVKALAAEIEVEDGPDEDGEMFLRSGRPADDLPAPFANDKAARAANNGALPPNLSLITKARADGPNYVFALLTGYEEAPDDIELSEGMSYNPYYAGGQIAMAPPLAGGEVEYDDGTEATAEQMSRDVVAFLAWAAEPKLEDRHRLGFKVMVFLIVLTVLLYLAKRRVWRDVH